MGKRKREKLLERKGKALQEKLKAWEEMDDDEEEVVQPTTQKSGNTKAKSLKRPPPPPRPPQESSEEDEDEDEAEEEDGDDDEDFHLEMGGDDSGEEGLESEEGSSIGDDFDGDDDEGSDIDDDGQESYDEEVDSDDELEEPPAGKDGMADMMAKILNQDVTTKVPVLAKRKTKLMKDMEEQKKASREKKEAAAKKRAALNHQLYTPDHTQVEPEKQLRKIATRGVVALFNAISKARATAQAEAEGATTKKIKTSSGKIVKPGEISKKDFLDLLKSSSKGPKAESGNDTVGAALGGGASGGGWAGVKDDLLVKTPKMNTYDDGMSEDEAGLDDEEEEGVPMDEDDDDSEGGGRKMAKSEKPKPRGDGQRKRGGGRGGGRGSGRGRLKTRHARGGRR